MIPKLIIFDLDGTLFRGHEPLPGAVETVNALAGRGIRLAFVTNNSAETRASVSAKLVGMGFPATPETSYVSGMAAAARCEQLGFGRVFVVGEPGLETTLTDAGLEVVGENADAVVCGVCRTRWSYPLLDAAQQEIRRGAHFFATNADKTYPLEGGRLSPGAGAMVAAIEACSGTQAEVCGKPAPFLFDLAMQAAGVSAEETLAIGDRYETDILGGQAAGCHVALVLTGVETKPIEGVPTGETLADVLRF